MLVEPKVAANDCFYGCEVSLSKAAQRVGYSLRPLPGPNEARRIGTSESRSY